MKFVTAIIQNNKVVAITDSREKAERLCARLAASGFRGAHDSYQFRYQKFRIIDEDIHPLVRADRLMRVTDKGESFTLESTDTLVWPLRNEETDEAVFPDVEWRWDRTEGVAYGELTVRGFSHDKVEETLRTVRAALIEDENMRSQSSITGSWTGAVAYA